MLNPTTDTKIKKGKVVLFQPYVFSATRPYYGAPLQLLGISRNLDQEGYEIKIITPITHENHIEDAVKEAEGAICFGITTMTGYSIYDGLNAARAIRKKYPKMPIVWGGWHPSILPVETCEDTNVDIVVKGQGERTFTELVHALESGSDIKDIIGICYKDKNGKVIENPDRPIESLDNFPPIPYHLVDIQKFLCAQEYGDRSLQYYTSFGCPHRCIFCVEQIVNKQHWAGLSPEKAAEEIDTLKKKYNIDSVQIIDSNFFVGPDRGKRFAKRLLELGTNIKWGNVNGRVRQLANLSDETWELMKKSGLECVLVGAEAGDQETLDYMKKDITVDDTLRLTEKCGKYDVKILASFLSGFPRSKDPKECHAIITKEMNASFKLIDKMFAIYPRIRMMFALYLPYPSTALFAQSKELGLEIPKKLEEWNEYLIAAEDATKMKVRQKWITEKQARTMLMSSIYIFFFKDPDSFNLVTRKINNKVYKSFLWIGFQVGKTFASLRWRFKFFDFPIDFYFYNWMRKYSQLG
jgi:anaerobic magnesium-protoporphyrin IX monomethyl ester cyclase